MHRGLMVYTFTNIYKIEIVVKYMCVQTAVSKIKNFCIKN